MNRSIYISTGALLLATLTFIAGRASSSADSPAPASATRLGTSTSFGRSLGGPREITKNLRPVTSPDESAQALLDQLARISVTEGSPRSVRPVLVLLEKLARLGTKALPPVRQFLVTGKDATYLAPSGQRSRDVKSIMSAVVPFSLRIALFDVVSQSGGKDAELILAENLNLAQNGMELACLSGLLDQISPGTYRDVTVAAVSSLLAKGSSADRNLLFEILKKMGDTSYVATAQQQMIQPDGQLDRNAMRYLQQAMGTQSLVMAARAYQDPRLTAVGSKEPLARVALSYVGADKKALELFHTALLDPILLPDQKRNLVEDLNEDGLSNSKTPTPEDLKIITNRYQLTQEYLQLDYVQNDSILNAAFREADKDLRQMLDKAAVENPSP